MRILFLTTQLPYPPVSGGVIKSWRLVEHWARTADLKIVHFLKGNDRDYVDEFKKEIGEVEIFSKEIERPRTVMNLVRSYFSSSTLNVYRNADSEVRNVVEDWARDSDIIFIDHYEMGQYIPTGTGAKVVFHEHNAEYVMWDRLAEIESNPLKRAAIKAEANRIKRTELKYARRSDLVLAAPNDIQELVSIGVPREKCEVTYHLGEDFMLEWPELSFDQTENALLFIGTLTWEANVDGLIWFLGKVWPHLMSKEPELKFYIVGKNPDPRIKRYSENFPGIILTGFVEDLAPYYSKARVFIIPLRFGSGIKVKLLNALYRGLPIVTTPIGTEGLEVTSGEELYISKEPEDQVKQVLKLLRDESIWNKMRLKSRETSKKYTWKKLLSKHDEDLRTLCESSS